MDYKFIPDYHLFDGEGAGSAGTTASQSASEQDIKTVQYGKSEGDGAAHSQVGTDNGAVSLEAEFEALTGKEGKFHDLLGQRISNAIQDRFKHQTDLQGQVDQISEDLSPLFMNYGLEAGDFEGLKKAIAGDDSFYQAGAERAGLDVEQYKHQLKLQADSDRLQRIEESYRQEKARQEMYQTWEADAAQLQQAFPAFDLGREIESNEAFASLLDNGIDVRTAFLSTHLEEIMGGAANYHQRAATQSVVNQIAQRASRPMEGALNHAPAIQRKSDPSSLSNDDLDEINRRVANGEVISF